MGKMLPIIIKCWFGEIKLDNAGALFTQRSEILLAGT
jgi:hypothetical protein